MHRHRTVHLGGNFPHIVATKSQMYQSHALKSRAAIPIQRITATTSAYPPVPGALGVPTSSDGRCSSSSSVTRCCKSFKGEAPWLLPDSRGASTVRSRAAVAVPFSSPSVLAGAWVPSDAASTQAKREASGVHSLVAGLASVVWHGNRQTTRSGSSEAHALQITCKQYAHWKWPG